MIKSQLKCPMLSMAVLSFIMHLFILPYQQNGNVHAYPASDAKNLYKQAMKEPDILKRIQLLQVAVRQEPEYVDALRELGFSYKQLSNFAEAEIHFMKAYTTVAHQQKKEETIFFLYELSQVQNELGKLSESEETLRGAIGITLDANELRKLYIALAENLLQQNKYQEATDAAAKANNAMTAKSSIVVNLMLKIEAEVSKQNSYQRAVRAYDLGDFEQAKVLFDSLLQIAGNNFKDVASRLEKINKELSKKQNTQIIESVYQKALDHEKNNRIEQALKYYQNILSESKYKDTEQRYQRLLTLKQKQDEESDLDRLYTQGLKATQEQRWIDASIAFEEIVEINPTYKDSQKRMQQINKEINKNQSESVLARYYADGLAAKAQKDYTKAHIIFMKLCNIDPNYEDARELLQEVENKVAQMKLDRPEEVAKSNPELVKLYNNAEQQIKLKNWHRAIVELEKIQIMERGFLQSDTLLTYCKMQLLGYTGESDKKSEEADSSMLIGFIIASIIMVPILGFVVVSPSMKVRYLISKKKYAEAARIYEKILQKYPNRISVLPMLAQIYLQAGRTDEQAIKIFKMIIQLNLSPEYHHQISSILTQNYLTTNQTTDAEDIHLLEAALADEYKKKNQESS
ncbi:MAG: tetratricopeptide repeat protein [Deferribacteres bacterium]|nr:tetratricopeptide repeat protein [candidate division KSB1 bacterium]MCB9501438.1 tetratricopeptide repeat protein [Deferribacteres bacterium]